MPTTINGVSWDDLPEYTEVFEVDGQQSVTRRAQVGWGVRYKWRLGMIGDATLNGSRISRLLPDLDPEFPWCSCQRVEMIGRVGIPLATGLQQKIEYRLRDGVTYGQAQYACDYRAVDYNVNVPDAQVYASGQGELLRYVRRRFTYDVENIPIPGNAIAWFNDLPGTVNLIPEPPSAIFPSKMLQYTWIMVPTTDITRLPGNLDGNIQDALGKVNSLGFDDGRYPAGTLLFMAPETKQYYTPSGVSCWDITFNFAYRRSGWNNLYRAKSGTFEPVVRMVNNLPTSDGLYLSAPFQSLFQLT